MIFTSIKLNALSLPSIIVSFIPLLATTVSILVPSVKVKDNFHVGVVPSRVTGVPSRTHSSQPQPGVSDIASLVLACFGIVLASGSVMWVRSRGQNSCYCGRREDCRRSPPPPPPPTPPAADEVGNDNAGHDRTRDRNDDDGDGDPEQDVGVGDENTRPEDDFSTAAAPAPEDPPPPPTGTQEDDGQDDDPAVLDILAWIFIVLLGLFSGVRLMTAATTSSLSVSETSTSTSLLHDQIQRRLPPSPLNGTESGKGSEPASVIHGLLQRRPSLRPQASEASAPASVIHGLLKRRPPSSLVDQQQQQLVPDFGLEVFNQGGLIVSSVPSAAPIRRRLHRIVWRNALPILLGLPALGLLTTIARLLLPPTNIPRVVDVCRVAQEPLPPPLPIAAPELPVLDDLKPDPPLVIPSPGPGPALPAPPVPASFPQETELQIEAKRLFGVTLAQTWDLHRQYERRILETEQRIRELERQEWELFVVTLARTWDSHRQNKRQISETERRVQELERQEWERVQTVLDG